jgi:predicted dehydrogenase
MSLWVVGAGPHARAYAKVLKALGEDFQVIGRGAASAESFEAATGQPVQAGGLTRALGLSAAPSRAIVSVSFEKLADVAIELIEAGTKRILLEKPGGLSVSELERVRGAAAHAGAEVLIAYNRRFYAATAKARELIAEDGGPVSCTFEFTEWAHTIAPMALPAKVKEAWLIANSSHVADLAFHLCGLPKDWKCWKAGQLDWHSVAARFCGAGITDRGVLFSYLADWEAPGRWSLEVLTRKRRFIFKPMEQLQVTMLSSVKTDIVEIDDRLDKEFKPGLFHETRAFLAADDSLFCTMNEQLRNGAIYSEMAGYPTAGASSDGAR